MILVSPILLQTRRDHTVQSPVVLQDPDTQNRELFLHFFSVLGPNLTPFCNFLQANGEKNRYIYTKNLDSARRISKRASELTANILEKFLADMLKQM